MQPIDFEETIVAARQQLDEALAAPEQAPVPAPATISLAAGSTAINVGTVHIGMQTIHHAPVAPKGQ